MPKKITSTGRYRSIIAGKRQRIRIPQPVERPIQLRKSNVLRSELIQDDPWWFTLHRRLPRRRIGVDPLEARAIPHSQVKGTLPERIVWLALVDLLHFVPGVDFDFQSSLQGGRMELGGIVADFLFPYLRIVIQVQGVTHFQFLRIAKDTEQKAALAEMGYTVFDVDMDLIYDVYRFEEWLRMTFTLANGVAGSGGSHSPFVHNSTEQNEEELLTLFGQFQRIQDRVTSLIYRLGG